MNEFGETDEESSGPCAKQRRANNTVISLSDGLRADFSYMFIHMLNSGDVTQIQSFLTAFMTPSCKFAIQHRVSPTYGLPQFLNSIGPDKFAHYLMGCFLIFPDLIINMADAKVSVSSNWKGTRIIMETEIKGSKLRNIRNYSWPPSMSEDGNGSRYAADGTKLPSPRRKATSPKALLTNASMNALIEKAQVVADPLQLRTKGSITLYLDENNCIRYMICNQVSL
jgi:hypothetical protein